MSFQYGSDSPEIKNPFKQEGLLFLLSGLMILSMGVLSIIMLRGQIVEKGLAAGWVNLVISLVLITGGIHFLAKGLFKISRFYVGRGVPASLAKNMARSEKHTKEPNTYYQSEEMEQMLMGRKNLTFHEPVTLFERMVYSLFPNFLFLPYSMRNYLNLLIRNVGFSLIAYFVYLIALLSGMVGLTLLTDSSFSSWLGIILVVFLLVLWIGTPLTVKKVSYKNLYKGKNKHIAWMIVLAILIPAIAELILRQGINIPAAPFQPAWVLVFFFLFLVAIVAAGLTLSKLRAEVADPETEVSEYRDHWQENVHPKDFFRALDMEMANLRYKEIPNRVYRELNPSLNMEGSMDKGSFSGDTIQETQPIYKEVDYPPLMGKLRFAFAIAGHCFVIVAALILYFFNPMEVSQIFSGLFYSGMFWIFGTSLLTLTHLYWGEMQFISYLIQFQGEGTYSESKLSVGMAITDSTRSENTIVRTSYSAWFLAAKVVTSTQARSGVNTLDQARYLMSMEKADDMLNHLVEHMKDFLDDRELIAATASEKDMNNIQTFYAVNEASSAVKLAANPQQQLPHEQDRVEKDSSQ
ncbi:hypothetical protein [Lederbergia galactosidilytica]|uniref:Uncharacterized protein n=2 Tax=Lederbergia galactosidilytica TaxID=217031 RepID=A0A177ZIQ5_9BACI|nr:hypothetical protein [Lederbergia galactosidilytica]MBP1914186.1 ABC-type multidrug transport system fused ATPase/permease subunit [Lederbergia galactosidilytica]OAK67359.1 hypothetical protein ABB05_19605 [Lederbergia galactosidilytica]